MKKITVYGIRFVNSYQDGMSLSQCEHLFGSREERAKFLADDDWTEQDATWSDEEGCAGQYEGWQTFECEINVPA